jgi:hypothetical protein
MYLTGEKARLTWCVGLLRIRLYETAPVQVRNTIVFIASRDTHIEEETITGGRGPRGIPAFMVRWNANELSNALHEDT